MYVSIARFVYKTRHLLIYMYTVSQILADRTFVTPPPPIVIFLFYDDHMFFLRISVCSYFNISNKSRRGGGGGGGGTKCPVHKHMCTVCQVVRSLYLIVENYHCYMYKRYSITGYQICLH